LARGNFENATFTAEPYILMKKSKPRFKLASAITFTMTSWKKFQIQRCYWMLQRTTCGPRAANCPSLV